MQNMQQLAIRLQESARASRLAQFTRTPLARIEQVLVNLFVNSLEAMLDGGSLVVAAKRLPTREDADIRLTLSDSGSGIPAERRTNIFDPYFTTKHHGMGLASCVKIIRQHHGSIDVESTTSTTSTTTCEITLPLSPLQRPVT